MPVSPGDNRPKGRFTAEPSTRQSSISFISSFAAYSRFSGEMACDFSLVIRHSNFSSVYTCFTITWGFSSPFSCCDKFDRTNFTFQCALFFSIVLPYLLSPTLLPCVSPPLLYGCAPTPYTVRQNIRTKISIIS